MITMSFGALSIRTKTNLVWRVPSSTNYSNSEKPEYDDYNLQIQNKKHIRCSNTRR